MLETIPALQNNIQQLQAQVNKLATSVQALTTACDTAIKTIQQLQAQQGNNAAADNTAINNIAGDVNGLIVSLDGLTVQADGARTALAAVAPAS